MPCYVVTPYIERLGQEQAKTVPLFSQSKDNSKDKTIYNEVFITQNAHFYGTLIKPFLDTFIMLTNQKVDVSWKDENGYNAIHWAVINNSSKLLKLLLSHFPEAVNETTLMSLTPLDLAIQHKHHSVRKILEESSGLTYNQLKKSNHKSCTSIANLISLQQGRDKLFQYQKDILVNQENLSNDAGIDVKLLTTHEENSQKSLRKVIN